MTFDAHHSRVATANGGIVKLWHLSPDGQCNPCEMCCCFADHHLGLLTELYTSNDEDSMISSLFFCEGGEQLIVCYLESHNMYVPSHTPDNPAR